MVETCSFTNFLLILPKLIPRIILLLKRENMVRIFPETFIIILHHYWFYFKGALIQIFWYVSQWAHPRRFTIDSVSKFHGESSSKLHQFWKVNPRENHNIDSTWKFRRGFDFQNRENIDEFSRWNRRNFCTRSFHCIIS